MKFQKSHEWAKQDGEFIIVGITDHAQGQLSDIVYVGLPDVGMEVEAGEEFMTVDSVKSSSEIYAPISGEVLEVNSVLEDEPELVNASAEGDGWFVKIKPSQPAEYDELMDKDAYQASIED
jgi:glycine cleavage system H protein